MLTEKYRPVTFEQLIGREKMVEELQKMIKSKDGIPHLFFYGSPGTGKTSITHVIASEILGKQKVANFYEFNASEERGIDTIRDKVIELCKRRPISSPYKIILMDEADHLTPEAQACFRRVFEVYHATTRFMFTANYPYKIIPPVLSRMTKVECGRIDVELIAKHLKKICRDEGLTFGDSDLINMAKRANGDMRSAIASLEGKFGGTDSTKIWETMTRAKLEGMSKNDRIDLAFMGEADAIFSQIWEFVQREKMWDKLTLLADCQAKMQHAAVKHIFVANMLDKMV